MTLTFDKNTPEIKGNKREIPLQQNATIYAGSLVLVDSTGKAGPGKSVSNSVCVGIAEKRAETSKGDTHVIVKSGVFGLFAKNNETFSTKDIGKTAYVVDEETLSLDSSSKSAAGVIFDVSGSLIWIKI